MEINDEASPVHLFQRGVRINRGRAGPIESHLRNAVESGSWPDEHDIGPLQSDDERPHRIGTRR